MTLIIIIKNDTNKKIMTLLIIIKMTLIIIITMRLIKNEIINNNETNKIDKSKNLAIALPLPFRS